MESKEPKFCGNFDFDLQEVMYYLYLPVFMDNSGLRLPPNVECCRELIEAAMQDVLPEQPRYIYLSARKGWATPDSPLNRPGWHADGFGTQDLNYVWWKGAGTRFAVQRFFNIADDHKKSLEQFDRQVDDMRVKTYPQGGLYRLDPTIVHATPIIPPPGQMRQYVKVSFSNHRYNLENNSHNFLFDYAWDMVPREIVRNDPHATQKDYAA